jgi:hypothetical protein
MRIGKTAIALGTAIAALASTSAVDSASAWVIRRGESGPEPRSTLFLPRNGSASVDLGVRQRPQPDGAFLYRTPQSNRDMRGVPSMGGRGMRGMRGGFGGRLR